MEHKIKKDIALTNLISDFEKKYEQGLVGYLTEKTILDLISFYEITQQVDKALEVIEIGINQFVYRADMLVIKAKLLLEDDQLIPCIEALDTALILSPNDKEILLLKIKVLCKSRQSTKAMAILNELKKVLFSNDLIELLVAEAYINECTKNYESMYIILKRALRLDPTHQEALAKFWDAVDLAKKYKDSINFHKELIDEHPYNHLAWFNLGMSYSYAWEYEMAIDALEYAFIINPDFQPAYIECAELCIQGNMFLKALDLYNEVYKRFGPDAEVLAMAASCLIKLSKPDEAKTMLQKAIKIDPYNEEVYYLLGQCFVAKSNWYSAINSYLKAVELDDTREEYYLELAKSYVKVEDYGKASLNFHKATSLASEDSVYWAEYISFLLKLRLFDEALVLLDEAEDTAFGAELLYCRAIALIYKKKKKAGLGILAEALEEDFSKHGIIFDLSPELEIDKDICSMIKYYENELQEYM